MAELAGIEIHACDITHTEIIFDHAYETAESFRTVKRAIIKPFEVMGDSGSFLQAPMILLQYSLDDEPLYLKVHWHGAYQCEPTTKYHCIPVGFPNDKDTTVETVD
jgi:hypothetical protein